MKKPLYIFLHMPKCAGSTFTYHIHHNLQPDKYIAMYAKDFCFGEKHIGDYYLKEAVADLKTLSKAQKDNIKIIFGHGIPYGIHTYFPNRDVRYFTFLREPMARTVSSYNFQRSRLDWDLTEKERRYYRRFIYRDNKVLSFKDWLTKHYDKLPNLPVGVSMTTFLQELGYLQKGRVTKKSLANMESRFWFMGLTEHFDHDVLWFYRALQIHKFYRNKNASESFVKNTEKYRNIMSKKNKHDHLLYDHVTSHYSPLSIGSMRLKQALVQPITQGFEDVLQAIYRYSAALKKKVPAYKTSVDYIKAFTMR